MKSKEKNLTEARRISLVLDNNIYLIICDLADKKGITLAEQIKFIIWNYLEISNIVQE